MRCRTDALLHRKSRTTVRQLAPVKRLALLVPHVAHDRVKLTIWQFFTGDVGQEGLSLVPRILEAGELVTSVVTMKSLAVTDVEIVACHAQSRDSGQGTRLPIASKPKVEQDDAQA